MNYWFLCRLGSPLFLGLSACVVGRSDVKQHGGDRERSEARHHATARGEEHV